MKIARYIPESPPALRHEEETQKKAFLLGTEAQSEFFHRRGLGSWGYEFPWGIKGAMS